MRLRIQSKTGLPRERAGFTFTEQPQIVEVGETELYPVNTQECRARGDWPPPQRADGSREPPRLRSQLLADDTDAYDEDGKQTRHGGLYIQPVSDEFVETTVERLNSALTEANNAAEQARRDASEATGKLSKAAADAAMATTEAQRQKAAADQLAARVAELEAKLAAVQPSTGAPERLKADAPVTKKG